MWIESHESLKEHPKLYVFMEELGITRPQAIGHLHLFWWWCSKYASSGKINGYSDLQIARAVDWDGDASRFRNALCNAAFVDEDNGVLEVHDWFEFRLFYDVSQERIERKKEQARQRAQKFRDRKRNALITHPSRKVTRTNNQNNQTKITKPNQNNTPKIPPLIDDVISYCAERSNGVDPQQWFSFYASKGWMIGKNKMRDWKAAVRTWERRQNDRPDQTLTIPPDL